MIAAYFENDKMNWANARLPACRGYIDAELIAISRKSLEGNVETSQTRMLLTRR
jgi:hypothetical protein